MDEPPRGRLRPARQGGLTSPDPGHRAPKAPAATRQTASQHPRQGPVDTPQKRKRQESHTRHHHQDHISGPTRAERHHQNSCGGSRLRAVGVVTQQRFVEDVRAETLPGDQLPAVSDLLAFRGEVRREADDVDLAGAVTAGLDRARR
jgi:hypothetical protein